MLSTKKLKIVAAIDTSPYSIAVLDEAAMYAKLVNADLNVILVEDINMINAASSPLVRSVNLFSFSSGSISTSEVKDIFALQKTTAEKTIKHATEKYGITITLDIRQGKVIDEILKGAEGADALIIGLAGWRFARYYYSTHMIEKRSRYKFPKDGKITVGNTAKKLLQKHQGTIFALRGTAFKNSRIMVYYDGTKESQKTLGNTLEYLSKIKNKSGLSLSVLLSSKKLRSEAFLTISNRDKELRPSFYTLKDSSEIESIHFIERLIDNTKSNMLVLPSNCSLIANKSFYEELDAIHSSLIIIR